MSIFSFIPGVLNPLPMGHMWSSRPIHAAFHPTFKIFSLLFDADCKEVSLQLQLELIDFQCSEDLKS